MFKQIYEKGLEFGVPVQLGIDIGNIILLFFTVFTLLITVWQIRKSDRKDRDQQREDQANYLFEKTDSRIRDQISSSKLMYVEYLKLAFANPKLSLAKYDENDDEDADKYDTFLSIMLYSFDEMLSSVDAYWDVSLVYQVETHEKYIRSTLHKSLPPEQSYRGAYGEKMLKIIDETLDRIDSERSTLQV